MMGRLTPFDDFLRFLDYDNSENMISIEIRHLGIILQYICVEFDSVGDKKSDDRSHDPVRGV